MHVPVVPGEGKLWSDRARVAGGINKTLDEARGLGDPQLFQEPSGCIIMGTESERSTGEN